MLKKLARFYPFLVVLAIFGALAIFIAAAPNKPAIFGGNNTDHLPLSSQTEPDTIEAIPRKAPTIPVVESTSITNTKVQVVDLMYGQQVRVNDGALYFETADFSGSGKQGTVGNRYTETLHISGFAAVDPSTGRLVEAEAYTRDEVPTGKKPQPSSPNASLRLSGLRSVPTATKLAMSVGFPSLKSTGKTRP